jgi:type IV secretory pathway TraG/TraD family ATPase VirD4
LLASFPPIARSTTDSAVCAASGLAGRFFFAGFLVSFFMLADCHRPSPASTGRDFKLYHYLAGGVGTGKTLMHREAKASVLPHIKPGSGRKAIVYDVKSDLIAFLVSLNLPCEILNFNPFDSRSVAWDIAKDVDVPSRARQFAHALVLEGADENGRFFANAARSIYTGVINAFNRRCPRQWTLRDLINVTADTELMRSLLGPSSRLVKQFFEPEKTFANVKNELATVNTQLEPVAALWEQTANKRSLRDWVIREESVLVLGGNEEYLESLQVLNRAMLKIVTATVFTLEESPAKTRLWFFCDELAQAGRLDGLPALMNARSKGVRCILGFQDFEGLFVGYASHDKAKGIIGKCDTISWLRLTTEETAEWASKRSGRVERIEYMETQAKDGVSVGEHLAERDSIMASEFMNLPLEIDGFVEGFHLIRGMGGVTRRKAKYEYHKPKAGENFCPRESDVSQELAEWNESDAIRIGIDVPQATGSGTDKTLEASGQEAPAPDLSKISRIRFD